MRRRTPAGVLFFAVASVLLCDCLVLGAHNDMDYERAVAAASVVHATLAHTEKLAAEVTSTTVAPTTTALATTTQQPTTTAPPPPPPPAPPVAPENVGTAWTLRPYQGLGVWIDVYDWTAEMTGGHPRVGVADIDRMADLGIQTIYIQTGRAKSTVDVMEPDRLLPMIQRAHERGMSVIAWYLPYFLDVNQDMQRMLAAAALPVDGLGVDIEALTLKPVQERTRRLLQESVALRNALGTRSMAAITQSAVITQVINPGFWPGFPWPELGQLYNVIIPMSYWSERSQPDWHSGERYTGADISLIRQLTGRADMPVHVAGGIASGITLDDVAGMVRAIQAGGALGGSLYDWTTSQPQQWDLLKALRVVAASAVNDIAGSS